MPFSEADPAWNEPKMSNFQKDNVALMCDIGELVGLWQDRKRPSRQVKALAQAHIAELEQKAQEILVMKATLEHLVHCCKGDERPDCPILENLAEEGREDVPTVAKARGRPGFAQR